MREDILQLLKSMQSSSTEEFKAAAVLVAKDGSISASPNTKGKHAYLHVIGGEVDPQGATLYLTHEAISRNAMKIVDAGVKQVYFIEEFDRIGSSLLRCMSVKVNKMGE